MSRFSISSSLAFLLPLLALAADIPDRIDYEKYRKVYNEQAKVSQKARESATAARTLYETRKSERLSLEAEKTAEEKSIVANQKSIKETEDEIVRAGTRIDTWNLQIGTNNDAIGVQDTQLRNLGAELTKKKNAISDQETVLDTARTSSTAKTAALGRAKTTHDASATALNEAVGALNVAANEVSNVSARLAELQEELKEVKKSRNENQNEVLELSGNLKKFQDALAKVQAEKVKSTSDQTTQTEKIKTLNNEITELEKKIAAATKEANELEPKIDTLRGEIVKAEKQAKEFGDAVQTQKDLIVSIGQQIVIKGAENTSLQLQEKEKRREAFKLTESMKADGTAKGEFETKKTDLEKVVTDRAAEIKALGVKASKTDEELKAAAKELAAATLAAADYAKKSAALTAQKTALEARKAAIAKEIEAAEKALKASLETLMTKEGNRKETEDALVLLKKELVSLNEKTAELNEKVTKLEEALKPEAEKLKTAKAEVAKLQEAQADQKKEIKIQTQALADATAAAKAAQKALDDKKDLDAELESLTKAKEKLAEETTSSEKESEQARAALKTARENIDAKKDEIDAAMKKIDAVQAQHKALVEEFRKAKEAAGEAKEKSDKVGELLTQGKKDAAEAAAELKAAQDSGAADDVIAPLKEKVAKADENVSQLEQKTTAAEKAFEVAKADAMTAKEKAEAAQEAVKAEVAAAEPLEKEIKTLRELQETAKESVKTAEAAQAKVATLVMENITALKTVNAKLALVATAAKDLADANADKGKAESAKIAAETSLAKTEGEIPTAEAKVTAAEKAIAETQADLDAQVKLRDLSVAAGKAKVKEVGAAEDKIAVLSGEILTLQSAMKPQKDALAALKTEEEGLPAKLTAVEKLISISSDEETKGTASVTALTASVNALKETLRMQEESKSALEGKQKADSDQVASYGTKTATLTAGIEKTEKLHAAAKAEADKFQKAQDENNTYIKEAPNKIVAATAAQNKAELDKRDAEKLVIKLNADLTPQVARLTLLQTNAAGWNKENDQKHKDLEKPTAELAKIKAALEAVEKQLTVAENAVDSAKARLAHLAKVDSVLEKQQRLLIGDGIPSEERALAQANATHLTAKRAATARFTAADADEKAYDDALEANRLAAVTVENEIAELKRREKARDDVKTAIAEAEATRKSFVDRNTVLEDRITAARGEIKSSRAMIVVFETANGKSVKHLEKLALDIPAAKGVEEIALTSSDAANRFAVNEERLTVAKQADYERILKAHEDEMKAAKFAGATDGKAAGARLGDELGEVAGGKRGDVEGGMNRDYDASRKAGEARGRTDGLAAGFKDGEVIGKEKGKEEGLPKGLATAYRNGKTKGFEKGREDAFKLADNDENRKEGEKQGYDAGLAKAKTEARMQYQPARDAEEKAIRAVAPLQTVESFDNNEEPAPVKPPQARLWRKTLRYLEEATSWLIPHVYAGPTGGTITDKEVPPVTDKYKKYATVEKPYDYEPFNEAYRVAYDGAYAAEYLVMYKDKHLTAYTAAYKVAYSEKTLPSYDAEKMRGDAEGYKAGHLAVYATEKERSRKVAHAAAAIFWEGEGEKDADKSAEGMAAGVLAGTPVGAKAGKEFAIADGKKVGEPKGYANLEKLTAEEIEAGKRDAQAEYASNYKPEALETKLVDGNADGKFERGEKFTLSVRIRNHGGRPVPKAFLSAEIDPDASRNLVLGAVTGKTLRELPANTLANYTKVLDGKIGDGDDILAVVNVRLDDSVIGTLRFESKAEGYLDATVTNEKSETISDKRPLNVGRVGEWKQSNLWLKNISGKKDLSDLNLYITSKDPNVTLNWGEGTPGWFKVPPFRTDGWVQLTVWVKVNKAGTYLKHSLRIVVGTSKGIQEKKYLLDKEILTPLVHQ